MSFLHTSRFRLIAVIWVACLFYMLFQGGKLSFMLFTGFTAIVLYLYTVSKSGISGIQITRSIPQIDNERITAGSSVDIHMRFHIPGIIPIPYVLVADRLQRRNGEEQTFESSFVPDWRRRGELTLTTPPLARGRYTFGETSCAVEDIFGFYQYSKNIHVPLSFTVYPQKAPISDWFDLDQLFRGRHVNSINSEVQRETTQFNGIREYIHGDPLSRIHWNASARTGTWKSKEYEKESLPRMLIVLDTASHYQSREQFETAVSTAASLLDYAQRTDLPIGLLTTEPDDYWLSPGRGKVMYEKLLNRLIDIEPGGNLPLEQVLQRHRRELDGRLFLAFITARSDAPFLQIVRSCKMYGAKSSVIQIAPAPNPEIESWQKELRTIGIPSYRIGSIFELPGKLGGGWR